MGDENVELTREQKEANRRVDAQELSIRLEEILDWMRSIRQGEAVGVKARRIAIAITQLELSHAYWEAYVVNGEDKGV